MSGRAVSDEEVNRVRQSFGRCTVTDEMLRTFYDLLTGNSPEVAAMFAQTDMARQRQLLRSALVHLISFATGNAYSVERVGELAESHSRRQINVRPELYDYWVDTLIAALREHDEQFDEDLEQAWRNVVAPGVAAMKAGY